MTPPDPQPETSSDTTEFTLCFLFDGDKETTEIDIATTAYVSQLKARMIKELRLTDTVRTAQLTVWKVIYIEFHTFMAFLKLSIYFYVAAEEDHSP